MPRRISGEPGSRLHSGPDTCGLPLVGGREAGRFAVNPDVREDLSRSAFRSCGSQQRQDALGLTSDLQFTQLKDYSKALGRRVQFRVQTSVWFVYEYGLPK